MNISSLVGFICSFAVFLGALMMTSRNSMIFIDLHAILIVIGGTTSASFVCFSFPRVFGLVKVFVRRMLGKMKRDYIAIIAEVVTLSTAARKGKQSLEAAAKGLSDPFLKDAAEILFWLESDVSQDRLRALLEQRANTHFERYLDEANIFRTIAKFPPAFGLMGTTLGMIALLQSLGQPDAKSLIGPSMAIALVATLYGIVLANFVFTPIAENLTKQTKEDFLARKIVVEAIMLIADNTPTKFVEEHCKSFLLPSERGGKAGGGARALQVA